MPEPPSAPQKISATEATESAITLSWEAPEKDGGAEVERYRASICSDSECNNTIETQETEKESITFSHLDPKTQYYLQVQAKNIAGWSAWSTQIQTATKERELPADVNRDHVVDFQDFLLFVSVFGSTQGDQVYDRWIDLDNDGIIGFNDFLIFAEAFGKTG